jgi:glycosyltransferase involved in cell wall biosynthesis
MTTLLSVNNYHYYRGGAETVFLEHNRMFEQLGWQVVPFAMHHERNLPSPWSGHFVDEIEFGESYSLREKLTRVPRVIYSRQARQRLAQLLDETTPDICHAHNLYHHISPSILGLLQQRGVPVVLTLHDLKIACPAYQMLASDGICERCRGGKLYNVVRHRCIKDSTVLSAVVMVEAVLHRLLGSYQRCVDRFVVPSRFYAGKLVEWGFPADKFRHIPNFVDVPRYQPEFAPGERYLYFGRLAHEKGLHTLVRAAAAVRAKLAIAGTGPELESLQRLVAETGADVQFLGYLSGATLHAAVRSARAVVLPSEWYENAPMSVLEAYALGKPVIGARIGGIPELIREEVTGFQFESGDQALLAAALVRVATTSDARLAEMGRAGRAWVESEFTAGVYLERMLALYGELGVATARATVPHAGKVA